MFISHSHQYPHFKVVDIDIFQYLNILPLSIESLNILTFKKMFSPIVVGWVFFLNFF
jgi:hypothetical protein